jgi:hypothetical protein
VNGNMARLFMVVSRGGVECYVATPTVSYPKDKVLLFLTDVYGHVLVNAQVRGFSSELTRLPIDYSFSRTTLLRTDSRYAYA